MITVHELFQTVPFEEAWAYLNSYYEGQNEESYRKVYHELRSTAPGKSNLICEIYRVSDKRLSEDRFWVDVHGYSITEQVGYAIEFTDWAEWLAMPVRVRNLDLTPAQMLAHILFEMTWVGYDRETIAEARASIMAKVESVLDTLEEGDYSDLIPIGEQDKKE